MTGKERVYAALSGKIPDRVPVFPKIWVDLASNLTGTDLTEVISDPYTALDVIFQAGKLCKADGIRQFHFPARRISTDESGRVYEVNPKGEKIGIIDMEGGLITHLFEPDPDAIEKPYFMAHNHYWTAEEPFVKNIGDAERIVVPSMEFFKEFGWQERQEKIIKKNNSQMAIAGDLHSATLAFYAEMRGINRALLDIVEEPQLAHRVMEKGAQIAIEKGKFHIDMGIKILRLNDSVGNMSVISPKHWRQFIYPHIRDVCSEIHSYDSSARIYCHICGNILPVVKDLVRTGIDCIGPLDPLGGFKAKDIRNIVNETFPLLGGVDTLSFINKSPEGIIEESRECIRQAGARGSYILSSGCVIPRNAPLENLLALRDASERFGKYEEGRLIQGD